MSSVERVTLPLLAPIQARSIQTSEDGSVREEPTVLRTPAMPGLRIQVRSTTSSLSDYAMFDLKTLLVDEKKRSLSDGVGG